MSTNAKAIEKRLTTIKGVAVKPATTTAPKQKNVGGVVFAEFKTGLVEFEVVADGVVGFAGGGVAWLRPGDVIYVTSQALASFPWGKEVFEVEGTSFIVVPPEFVVAKR